LSVCMSVLDAVDTQIPNTSHFPIVAICSSVIIVILMLSAMYLIYKHVRMASVKGSTRIVTRLPQSSAQCDIAPDLQHTTSGYTGSGSGMVGLFSM